MSNNDTIHLACCADDNYSMQLAVMVASVIQNLSESYCIALYVVDGGITEENRRKISYSLREKDRISFLTPSDVELEGLKVSGHVSIAAYYRLLIPQLLPHLKKVLYLDCDLVVDTDISCLWEQDVNDVCVGAVEDLNFPTISVGIQNYQELGLNGEAAYFNSGVLLMNLELWRDLKISRIASEYIKLHRKHVRFWDQDGLNVALIELWKPLDRRWNRTMRIYDYSSWQASPFEREAYYALLDAPFIAHFTTKSKPWNTYRHPDKKIFYQYLDQSAWAGWRFPLWRAVWKRVVRMLAVRSIVHATSC